jgi:hypothetical protein
MRDSSEERGAIAVMVAMTTVVFLALLAFVVDLAMIRVERADAQGAADNASQSAAWASCKGKPEAAAKAAGESVAAANGYPAAVVAFTGGVWRTTIDVSVPASFSSLITGDSEVTSGVSAEARGNCSPSVPLPALFAGSTSCGDKTFEWSGSGNTVNGDIHSNDWIKFGGTNTVNGEGTYVDTAIDPNKITWTPNPGNPAVTGVQLLPIVFDINDYRPTLYGGSRSTAPDFFHHGGEINQSWLVSRGLYNTTTKVMQDGTYYSNTGFDLGSMAGARGNVTLVTPGQIKVSPSDVDIRPYEDGLLLFSDYHDPGHCDSFGVDISGSDNDWEGVVYAPRSQVKYQGSTGFTMSGSIVADTLYISGSGFNLSSPTSTAPGDTTVLLMR